MKEYNNPYWEPVFCEISPILSKIYFKSKNAHVKKFVAFLIFKKLDFMENGF